MCVQQISAHALIFGGALPPNKTAILYILLFVAPSALSLTLDFSVHDRRCSGNQTRTLSFSLCVVHNVHIVRIVVG